jgi:N utilization substance protein A
MKGSRVQAIIKELRGEKIDIIEWSDEPSVFAANALSPAKVSQVRITDINNRLMEVIVGEDQLSLAIGKKGQNVRLAARLVGWEIKIVSEEILKKEIAQKMGKMMASGEAVPITALEGVTSTQADTLAEKGIADVEKLAAASVDDLVEFLDVSMDEAESIRAAAANIVKARNVEMGEEEAEDAEAETESGEAPAEVEQDTAEVVEEPAEDADSDAVDEPSDVAAGETVAEDGDDETADTETVEASDDVTDEEASVEPADDEPAPESGDVESTEADPTEEAAEEEVDDNEK